MLPIELACLAILALYLAAHRRTDGAMGEAALLCAGAIAGEHSMITLYGFYAYAPGWHAFVGTVPLMIGLIWPAVVLSARETARALLGPARAAHHPARLALATGLLVLFDAALIEPIAVRAGLWRWHEPGVLGVPYVGILGWGVYAAAATYALARLRGAARLALLVLAPLATHAALLAAWWGALRWVLRGAADPRVAAACVAVWGAAVAVWIARRGATLPWRELGPRAAATGFFAYLLARDFDPALALYTAAFTPPHLLLCAQSWRAASGAAPRVALS